MANGPDVSRGTRSSRVNINEVQMEQTVLSLFAADSGRLRIDLSVCALPPTPSEPPGPGPPKTKTRGAERREALAAPSFIRRTTVCITTRRVSQRRFSQLCDGGPCVGAGSARVSWRQRKPCMETTSARSPTGFYGAPGDYMVSATPLEKKCDEKFLQECAEIALGTGRI